MAPLNNVELALDISLALYVEELYVDLLRH